MKTLNFDMIEIDGIDMTDYPDLCDAYISYAEWSDGTELTQAELDNLTEGLAQELLLGGV